MLQIDTGVGKNSMLAVVFTVVYLVAGAAALAVLEQWLVAAGPHGHEGVVVGVLEAARAT